MISLKKIIGIAIMEKKKKKDNLEINITYGVNVMWVEEMWVDKRGEQKDVKIVDAENQRRYILRDFENAPPLISCFLVNGWNNRSTSF